jgi:pilus assembly protein CpaB
VTSIPGILRSINAILAATAVCAGALGFWGASRYVQARASLVEQRLSRDFVAERIVVAGANLAAGRTLAAADLASRAVPVHFASSDRVPARRATLLIGRRMAHAVRKGDPLGSSDVEPQEVVTLSARLESGQRAITFPVDDVNSFSGLLTPGDMIDLLYATHDETRATQVVPLLQAVRVLATGKLLRRRRIQDSGGTEREVSAEFVTVTLHVAPADAARIVLAQQTGDITAVLRNASDQAPIGFTRLDSRSLLAPPRKSLVATPRREGRYLDLIVGGSGGAVALARRVPVLALSAGTTDARPPEVQ